VTDNKLYSFGGWNSETQYNNLIYYSFETKEWSDPDIYIDVSRWNHCSLMVEAIPSWKYFIFGGEATNFAEGQQRAFGQCVNTAAVLDLESYQWQHIEPENVERPENREYSAMFYDRNQLCIFGGWSNGWLNDMWTLNVSKIVGPSYAITEIDPPLGQLSGGDTVTIRGQGFREQNCIVYFTCGKTPTPEPTKMAIQRPGTFVNETTITCETPDFT
jgi:dynein heavy chain, axonemal